MAMLRDVSLVGPLAGVGLNPENLTSADQLLGRWYINLRFVMLKQ